MHLISMFIGILALLPSIAAGQSAFDEYKKKKQSEFETYKGTKQKDYIDYITRKRKEFDDYRRKKNEEFAKYLAKPWKEREIKEGIKSPIEKEIKPIIYKGKEEENKQGKEIKGEVVRIEKLIPQPQPEPVVPIIENEETTDYSTFTFYGTTLKVRWGDIAKFRLSSTNEKAIANAYKELTSTKYNNLMSDCLELRKEYDLCDWGYFQMLKILAETACGKQTNEAVFLQGFLYQESGYIMRFGINPTDSKLHLLVRINGSAYDSNYYMVDNMLYYLFDGCKAKNLKITDFGKEKGKEMRLEIDKLPKLSVSLSKDRTIAAPSFPISVKTNVNKNLVFFFNDYPTSYCNNNFMTRWAYYANTPLSEEVKERVYPVLREKLANTTQVMAVNMLLNWVQPSYNNLNATDGSQIGFPYLYDNDVWGHDRAFFAEETFYYPGSDCEDHAILFSHLVRDLLGLDVVLVYYPQHLATAVCFDEEVKGDYIMLGNRKFVVADPTYSRARVGMTMPQCQGKETKVILCNR